MTNAQNDSESIVLEEIEQDNNDNRTLFVSANGKTRYRKRKGRAKKPNIRRVKKILLIILVCILVIGFIAFAAYSYLSYKGKKELLDQNKDVVINTIDNAATDNNGHTVVYNGDTYRFNEDLISIVILGVDKSELDAEEYGKAGQADAIYIFTYDTKSGKSTLIPVSRETMTEVKLYSTSGEDMGMETMQLCLSYAYGNGKDTSCQNTIEALSRAFYNIPFSKYIALNWDAIGPLNDVIGGVTLTALEDVKVNRTVIYKDENVTLMGDDAWAYIKYRDTSKLESNPDRINRQKQYINAYITKLLPLVQNDITLISDLYGTASEYMYSNISRNNLIYLASQVIPNIYSTKDINYVTIEGEIKQGEVYAEFYPDETALYETILKVFYLKDIE